MAPKKTAKAVAAPDTTRASRSKSVAKPTESKSVSRKSKSVPPAEAKAKSSAKPKKSVTDTESEDRLQFDVDTFVAFLDKQDIQEGEQKISIGKVSRPLQSNSFLGRESRQERRH